MTLLVDTQDNLPAPKPIPRHKGHWLWGGTFDFQRNPAEFLLEAHERYGDIFVTRVLTGQSYFIRDQRHARQAHPQAQGGQADVEAVPRQWARTQRR